MDISPISSSILNLLDTGAVSVEDSPNGESFSDIFTELLNTVQETDTADKVSALELLSGASDDMSGLLLDAEKAEISLNLALQIRNKVLDAYDEIMGMSI